MFIDPMAASGRSSDGIGCPLCGGSGLAATRTALRGLQRHVCPICGGNGVTTREQVDRLQQLRDYVELTAGLMQIGDADAAAGTSRLAFRIARALVSLGR